MVNRLKYLNERVDLISSGMFTVSVGDSLSYSMRVSSCSHDHIVVHASVSLGAMLNIYLLWGAV